MPDRIKYSIQKKVYTVSFKGAKYYGEDFDTLIAILPKECLQKYEFTEETLQHARGKAKRDRLSKRIGIKRGIRGWSKPGYKLQPKSKTKSKNEISKDKYEAALNNIEWAIKMKNRGYNSLPYYLEARRIICEYTGTHYEESVEKEKYYSL